MHTTTGYAVRTKTGEKRLESLHRLVLGLQDGDGLQCDHINGNRLDNRLENLRVVTKEQNAQNCSSRGGTSQYRGVHWNKRRSKWKAVVKINNKQHLLGHFDDEEEAAQVASDFRREHMKFANEDRIAFLR